MIPTFDRLVELSRCFDGRNPFKTGYDSYDLPKSWNNARNLVAILLKLDMIPTKDGELQQIGTKLSQSF